MMMMGKVKTPSKVDPHLDDDDGDDDDDDGKGGEPPLRC